jgi:hypothetical protein
MITLRNARNWPIFQAETDLYQVGNDGGWTYNVHNDFTSTLTSTLECIMAGAAVNYYYTYHSWDVEKFDEVPYGLSAYGNAGDFFRSTAWRTLGPNEALINSPGTGRHCLANPGFEYVVYLQAAGNVTLAISGAPAGNSLAATWLNVVTGARQPLPNTGNGSKAFSNPWPEPALLHVARIPPPDTTPPAVSIASPTNGASLYANLPVTIQANITDDVGVAFAELRLDGALQPPTKTNAPFTFIVSSPTLGGHTLAVVAQDAAGNRATNSVDVTLLAPTPPPLSLVLTGGVNQIVWTAPGFVLQQAGVLPGLWTNMAPQPMSPLVVVPTNSASYYRLHWVAP